MPNKRLAGLDFGLARIGVAVSDPSGTLASGLGIVKAHKKRDQTARLVWQFLERDQKERDYTLEAIILGFPLLLSGKVGTQADAVTLFQGELAKLTAVPIILWDERLTTMQAERALREAELNRKQRSQVVDTVAAIIILQNYLAFLQGQRERQTPPPSNTPSPNTPL